MNNLQALQARARAQQPQDMSAGEAVVAGGATLQRTTTPFVTAVQVQVPRDIAAVEARVMDEIDADPEGLYYQWKTKNADGTTGTVKGPTIELAMLIAREWGNCNTYGQIAADEGTHWLIEGHFVDLERGYVSTRPYRQRKPGAGKGRMDRDRIEDIEFQIGVSKAVRNAIVRALPRSLLHKAEERVKQALARQIKKAGKNVEAERVCKAFERYKVTPEQLEQRLGKAQLDWTPEDLVELRLIYQALKTGESTAAAEFGGEPPEPTDDLEGALLGDRDPGAEG